MVDRKPDLTAGACVLDGVAPTSQLRGGNLEACGGEEHGRTRDGRAMAATRSSSGSMFSDWVLCWIGASWAITVILACPAAGEDPRGVPAGESDGMVHLNFPEEIPIEALVEYASKRLGIHILYDREVGEKRINLRSPGEIPADSLLGVLESALKMSGLVLIEAEAPGWKKIVKAEQLARVAPTGEAADVIRQYGEGTAVTQAFVMKHAKPEEVARLIEPFLTQPGSNVVTVPQSNALIVTDYASNVMKLAYWIESIDKPRAEVTIEFVPVQHHAPGELSTHLTAVLAAKSRARGMSSATPDVEVIADERASQLLLIGPQVSVLAARELITSLDRPLGLVTKTYQFRNVSARKVDELVRGLLTPATGERSYRSVIDDSENLLIVTASESVHDQIAGLREVRDVPLEMPESPIRFYKIKNLPVQDLLDTLRSIESNTFTELRRPAGWRDLPTDGRIRSARAHPVPGPNLMPFPAGHSELPLPPALTPAIPDAADSVDVPQSPESSSRISAPSAELLGRARISGDAHTNTLIVIAEPAVQRLYEELLRKLDYPRPQVLVEAKFVIIDTSDNFSLGVEVSAGDRSGLKRVFAFSSYGLSTVDPVSGALSIIPGLAFNGTLVDPETADVVTRALVTNRRARVTSAPRILVSDNATGQLASVEEVPFTSVNASQTVATTSFAGFADAGTTITVTPRVRDETSLQLDVAISVNTFTGAGSQGVPPPRQTEEVTSQVIVPDGHTVILGGLNRRSDSYAYTGLPLLNRIPIVREATGLTSKGASNSSMFIFIRPVILQEDRFKDLRYVSERDARAACIRPDYPESRPVWMR